MMRDICIRVYKYSELDRVVKSILKNNLIKQAYLFKFQLIYLKKFLKVIIKIIKKFVSLKKERKEI